MNMGRRFYKKYEEIRNGNTDKYSIIGENYFLSCGDGTLIIFCLLKSPYHLDTY